MSFIGIVANKKFFENIKRKFLEEKKETINFIQINLRSIENVKNIKFETIVIEDNIQKFKESKEIIKKICNTAQYTLINTDKNQEYNEIEPNGNVITYGINQKATVTISSISDLDILIYLQKEILNKEHKKMDIEERRVKRKENRTLKTYDILAIYTISKIYGINIIEEI